MVAQNLAKIRDKIIRACDNSGRDPKDITVVAVTKGVSFAGLEEGLNAGITDIGENRIQEALPKYGFQLKKPYPRKIKWHMIGHLQTNKVKEALEMFDLIQSVDSLRVAGFINQAALKIGKVQDVLIEVNTSAEEAKFGFKPTEVPGVMRTLAELKNINIKGLMTVAAIVDNPAATRPYFASLRKLRDEINGVRGTGYGVEVLSMGMSDDFEAAIEEGATMVRLGRAIFH